MVILCDSILVVYAYLHMPGAAKLGKSLASGSLGSAGSPASPKWVERVSLSIMTLPNAMPRQSDAVQICILFSVSHCAPPTARV
jgi:hypothetical protein